MKECLIVIASFADGYLDNLLKSVKENTIDVDYMIQVVDNHKDDELLNELVIPICEKHNVNLHLSKALTGYGDALNTGVKVNKNDSKYILYMDSDTLVSKGWLRELIDCYERHEDEGCYMVGPLVKNFDGKYLPGVYEHYGAPEELKGNDFKLVHPNKYLIGVCILRKRNTIPEFTWDKNFYRAYWEDNDLTAQIRFLKKDIYVAGKSLMFHKVNSSHKTIRKEGENPSTIGKNNKFYFHYKWDEIHKLKEKITAKNLKDMTSGEAFYKLK